ncbi:MAG: hypothetical protein IPO58_26670 [Betaproteobacteria bacterium]|nr:hypothetical protein [Betaproteobacteria bacterium]
MLQEIDLQGEMQPSPGGARQRQAVRQRRHGDFRALPAVLAEVLRDLTT